MRHAVSALGWVFIVACGQAVPEPAVPDSSRPFIDPWSPNATVTATPPPLSGWPELQPLPAELDMPPWLNMPLANRIVVSWRTVDVSSGTVHYGKTPEYGETAATTALDELHHVDLGVLPEASQFYYEVRIDGTNVAYRGSFVTPGSQSFRFLHLGEFHADSHELEIAQFAEVIRDFEPHVIVESGDMVNDGNKLSEWRSYMRTSAPWISNVILLAAGSNHVDGFGGNKNLQDLFVLPNNERWYSTRYSQVQFFTLDSTYGILNLDITLIQPGWVGTESALAHDGVDDPTFVVGAWHYPACSSQYSSRTTARVWVQSNLIRSFTDNGGIDLVLVGHDKYYERSTVTGGIVHVQSNIGKISPGDPGNNHPDCSPQVTIRDTRAVVFASVNGTELDAFVLDENGVEIDAFSISK